MAYSREFNLPPAIKLLVSARNEIRKHFGNERLKFTLDGNLVGDIGEAIAVELFGVTLHDINAEGIDGTAPNGRTVQIKATGTRRGPAYRNVATHADVLLFFCLDYEGLSGTVAYNGPEKDAVALIGDSWVGQRLINRRSLDALDKRIAPEHRLQRLVGH